VGILPGFCFIPIEAEEMKEQEPLNELYQNILNGSAKPGDKERLARWMARFDAPRKIIADQDLLEEQRQARIELKEHFFPSNKTLGFFRPWIIAASFILITLSALLMVKLKEAPARKNIALAYTRNSTIPGEKKLIILADGSRVFMNGESSIKYQKVFTGKTREIYLQGQAYFQVSHDKTKPFIVHAGKLTLQVLGTTFDVKNYPDDTNASVTVASGKVSVKAKGLKSAWILTPGEQLSYDQNSGKAVELDVDTTKYMSWKDGALVFRNCALLEIAKQLQRAYGVKITIKTTGLQSRKLSLRVKAKENITQVMEMLSIAGDFKYNIKDRTISISE